MAYPKDKLFTLPLPVGEERTFSPDLKGLIAWLETQEPETAYDFDDIRDCLIARFGKISGLEYYGRAWSDADRRLGGIAVITPHTYGAALSRARRALAEAK